MKKVAFLMIAMMVVTFMFCSVAAVASQPTTMAGLADSMIATTAYGNPGCSETAVYGPGVRLVAAYGLTTMQLSSIQTYVKTDYGAIALGSRAFAQIPMVAEKSPSTRTCGQYAVTPKMHDGTMMANARDQRAFPMAAEIPQFDSALTQGTPAVQATPQFNVTSSPIIVDRWSEASIMRSPRAREKIFGRDGVASATSGATLRTDSCQTATSVAPVTASRPASWSTGTGAAGAAGLPQAVADDTKSPPGAFRQVFV